MEYSKTPKDLEIERLEKEYQDFAYIVSHDLRAPLRHVKEFTNLLIGSREENLSAEDKEYLFFLNRSLEKIDDMQKALLSFSRLNTRAEEREYVDLNQVIDNVLLELGITQIPNDIIFEKGDLPVVLAEKKQMNLLFFSLIDNALKFHSDETTLKKISISVKDEDGVWVFEISDNGIGIDPQFHDLIFRFFQRLEPNRYPGIGAGLSISKKIIELHGGEILIESSLGKGTEVCFFLPKT